jgi:hypothetical protein
MLISFQRYRRKRWRFDRKDLPPAAVIPLPIACPRLILLPNQVSEVEMLDDYERITLYRKQICLIPSLGIKIDLAYRALVLEIGQEAADAQVWQIVSEYIEEKEAA